MHKLQWPIWAAILITTAIAAPSNRDQMLIRIYRWPTNSVLLFRQVDRRTVLEVFKRFGHVEEVRLGNGDLFNNSDFFDRPSTLRLIRSEQAQQVTVNFTAALRRLNCGTSWHEIRVLQRTYTLIFSRSADSRCVKEEARDRSGVVFRDYRLRTFLRPHFARLD